MLFQSVTEKTFKQLFDEALAQASNLRKTDADKRLDYYHDEQIDYIKARLAQHFKNADKLSPCFVNIVKKIVNNLAMVYLRDAQREVEGNDKDQQIFDEIARTTGLAQKMKMANRYAKLLKTVLLRPVWRQGRMDLDILTPDILDCTWGDTPEDLQSVTIAHYPDSGKVEEIEYSLWTAQSWARLTYRGIVKDEGENPYEALPFIVCWDYMPTSDFWLPGGDDLITLQDAINERLTDFLFVLRMQGFGVPWIRGEAMHQYMSSPEGFMDLVFSPGQAVEIPNGNGEIGFAQANAPIEETQNAIDKIIKWAAVSNGLPAGTLSTEPTEESGVSKIVSNRELDELRRDDIALFTGYERNLFDLFKIVWNVHNPTRKISEKAELKIDFYDPETPQSPEHQIDLWDFKLTQGLMSKVDLAMQLNPDLTREQAIEQIQRVRKENLEINKAGENEPVFDFDK